jgi:PTH1 family peptidyl-tRNA hydrolase
LADLLQPGDLLLLKGVPTDGLEKLIDVRFTGRRQPPPSPETPLRQSDSLRRAVVGLGNPGDEYVNTPHNMGQRVVDLLAASFSAEWLRQEQALVAEIALQGTTVFLIKPQTPVNASGAVVLDLSRKLGFGAADCILVQDDLDIALGGVRVRRMGGDGGHKGVRSILQAFRTDAVRRVKIGVGRPRTKLEPLSTHRQGATFVVEMLGPAERASIEPAINEAAKRTLQLLAMPATPRDLSSAPPKDHPAGERYS